MRYHHSKNNITFYANGQSGFTLIELMISLVLGLLISAAVVQIYITNVRTSTVQKSGSELQDASVFGIQMLENHIRLANLGNSITQITDTTPSGGIVLTPQNLNIGVFNKPELLSHSAGDTPNTNKSIGWSGISHTVDATDKDIGSDQLTLQFINKTPVTIADCEGNDIAINEMVIERYFLRPSMTDSNQLVLACDAGRIDLDPMGIPITIHNYSGTDQRNFGNAGQEFILNVDQFKVLLGVQSAVAGGNKTMQYISSRDYNALTTVKPAIVSIKLGIIVHGATPIVGSDDATDFTLLGQVNKLPASATRQKLARTTYESTTTLRNARVIS